MLIKLPYSGLYFNLFKPSHWTFSSQSFINKTLILFSIMGEITYIRKPNKKETIDKVLHPFVKSWFYGKFDAYSLPQLHAIPHIHARENILVSAATGSGKTLTAFLAILNELIDSSDKNILEDKIYCIYISPDLFL